METQWHSCMHNTRRSTRPVYTRVHPKPLQKRKQRPRQRERETCMHVWGVVTCIYTSTIVPSQKTVHSVNCARSQHFVPCGSTVNMHMSHTALAHTVLKIMHMESYVTARRRRTHAAVMHACIEWSEMIRVRLVNELARLGSARSGSLG
jgi:hypothetical protein